MLGAKELSSRSASFTHESWQGLEKRTNLVPDPPPCSCMSSSHPTQQVKVCVLYTFQNASRLLVLAQLCAMTLTYFQRLC